jgi:hypothetical protein
MTDIKQIHDDLKFVREAVSRHDRQPPRATSIYWIWAVYVLVGYTMLDLAPNYAGWFFLIGGIVGGIISAIIGKRASQQAGEIARADARREALHWFGGIVLIFAGVFGLATVIPALRGPAGGQLIAVMFGFLYFFTGVHFDRNFLWLGPVLMAGGIVVGMVPRYGWTGLGIIVALGLVVPTLFPRRPQMQSAPAAA